MDRDKQYPIEKAFQDSMEEIEMLSKDQDEESEQHPVEKALDEAIARFYRRLQKE